MCDIEYRETPWDQKVFNKKTCEILNINEQKNKISFLKEEYELIYSRVSVDDIDSRRILNENGFIACEVSALVKLSSLHKIDKEKYKIKKHLILSRLDEEFKSELIHKSNDMYQYSRFHESEFIDKKLANIRMNNWILDLVDSKEPCYILKTVDKIIGYMFVKISGQKAELLLGGVFKEYSLYALNLWEYLLLELNGLGVKTVVARISMSNIGVLRLYQKLGFKIENTSIDYQYLKQVNNE